MSLWDVLSGAVDQAGSAIGASAQNVIQSTVSSISVEVKTNLGPAFTLGGQSSDPTAPAGAVQPSTGLLDLLGIKFSATAIDASGKTLYTYGTPPATNPVLVAVYLSVAVGVGFLLYRGIRSLF